MSETQIPAGWYPDPQGTANVARYWDGERWTVQTQSYTLLTGAPGSQPAVATAPAAAGGYPAAAGSYPAASTGYPATPAAGGSNWPAYPVAGAVPAAAAGRPDRRGFAISGFVLGLISLFGSCLYGLPIVMAILGIIFSALGLKSSNRPLAIAGLAISIVATILCVAMIIFVIAVYVYAVNSGQIPNLPNGYY
ncbi:MAG: DUF2510 domain-containing protein [Actinomycetia bacterium]|nr:DUF2510 domain-containing protein [Actinomycetes bacterium]